MSELAQQLIEENRRTQNKTLDLGNCGLSELPDLSGMDWVETLILSHEWWEFDEEKKQWVKFNSQNSGELNQIIKTQSFHPHLLLLKKLVARSLGISDGRFLEKLTKLNSLDLGNNQISDGRFLEKLTNLSTLNLRSNQITDGRFLEKLKNLTTLNLGDNKISDGRYLEKLPNLATLHLWENPIVDWRFLEKLTNLTTLNLLRNKISSGSILEKLTGLSSLYLSYNEIGNGRFLEKLTNLTSLELSNNKISDGRFLQKLTGLTKINLSSNQISDWRFLEKLTNLTSLELSNNQISDGRFLEKLTGLTKMNLSSNQISDWRFLEKLTNLTSLELSNNQISDGRFLEKLINLTSLELSNNQISDGRFLGNLTKLTSLDLKRNQISDGRFLSNLTNLTSLLLSSNQISDGRFLEKLTGLNQIDLAYNQLNDLAPLRYFIQKKGMKVVWKVWPSAEDGKINLKDNPFSNPPVEIVQQGNAAILEYFRQKEKAGIKPLLEAKMVLLGDGRAGKTSLACRMLGKDLPRQEDRTQGVDIVIGEYRFPVEEGEFVLHIWDFAGQDKYKPLHQFFYTEGAVYVMVADSGNAQTDFADWFETAEMFGGAGSPLLVALNEFREGMGIGSFDEEKWRKQFPKLIKEVRLVNLLSQKGFSELEKDIRHLANQLPHTRTEYPANWANIRAELERRRDENYISLSEYLKICRQLDLPERESALILSGILHRIGVCLHYKSPLLEQHVILKNEWATAAVYKILEDRVVAEEKKGFFDWSDLRRIWSDDSYQDMQPQLLALMSEFKMAYPLPNGKEFVTPPLLPTAPPQDWDFPAGDAIEVRVEYEFLPKALMTQFIVSRHPDIDRGRTLVWREGVVLRWSADTLAQVSKIKSRGRDALQIRAVGGERRGLLTAILKTLRDLHDEYRGIRAHEIVPCPCDGCRTEKNPQHYFDFKNLSNRLEKGRRVVECDQSLEEVDLLKILGDLLVFERLGIGEAVILKDVDRDKTAADTIPSAPLAFFSYSKHDLEYLQEFQKHLKTLERQGLIRFWDDRHIRPGEEWDDEIKSALGSSDIVFLLVSVDFLNTEYIWETEITEAMRRHEAGEAKVIPIKIRQCDWAGTPFAKLQGLPRKDKIIGSSAKNDEVWAEVVVEIKKLV